MFLVKVLHHYLQYFCLFYFIRSTASIMKITAMMCVFSSFLAMGFITYRFMLFLACFLFVSLSAKALSDINLAVLRRDREKLPIFLEA